MNLSLLLKGSFDDEVLNYIKKNNNPQFITRDDIVEKVFLRENINIYKRGCDNEHLRLARRNIGFALKKYNYLPCNGRQTIYKFSLGKPNPKDLTT